jgi:hypothetical protein
MLIYDALGNLKTPDWLVAKYGQVTVHSTPGYTSEASPVAPAEWTGPGWRVFALVEDADYPSEGTCRAARGCPAAPAERTGHTAAARPPWWPKPLPDAAAAIVVKTISEAGEPLVGAPVARYWPDAPVLPPDRQHWQERGVIGYTNVDGDTGFGMGEGDYYAPPTIPPTWVWIAQPGVPTEAVSGLGMLAGTNHDHINVVLRWDSGAQPPPPPPPPADELVAIARTICALLISIDDTAKRIYEELQPV